MELLGLKVEDRVTGIVGIVTSISYDLFGCIQGLVNPGLDKEQKERDLRWFDVARLRVLGNKPVMSVPSFAVESGPESRKPAQR